MTAPVRRSRRAVLGFTLVEVLVAAVLLAVGILGLSASVGVIGGYLSAARLRTRVSARAQAEIERRIASSDTAAGGGALAEGAALVVWERAGGDPQEIRVVARRRLGPLELADTLVVRVARSARSMR